MVILTASKQVCVAVSHMGLLTWTTTRIDLAAPVHGPMLSSSALTRHCPQILVSGPCLTDPALEHGDYRSSVSSGTATGDRVKKQPEM